MRQIFSHLCDRRKKKQMGTQYLVRNLLNSEYNADHIIQVFRSDILQTKCCAVCISGLYHGGLGGQSQ